MKQGRKGFMELKMKNLTLAFGTCVVGIVLCFCMTIYTSIQIAHQKDAIARQVVPMPAMSQ